jgi:bifunctional non-homologous end joining protein LigD
MLAHPTDIELARTRQKTWAMEPKLDGVRVIITRHRGKLTLTSRSGKSYTEKLPALVERLYEVLPPQTVLDAELGYPVGVDDMPLLDFNKTMRVLGSGPAVAIQKQAANDGEIIPILFDVLYWNSENLMEQPLWDRRRLLDTNTFGTGLDTTPYAAGFDESLYDQYVAVGGEGVMLKNPEGRYHPGKRPSQVWVKLKKWDTDDAWCTGKVLPGKGKYEGKVGAVYFETAGGDTGKCSGMDDLIRDVMTTMWATDQLKGRAFEVKWFGKVGADQGGLRHPNFVRWRPDRDKDPLEKGV